MTYLDVEPSPSRAAWRMRLYDIAEFHGWKAHLFGADFPPDLVLVRRPQLVWIFAEPDRGKLSAERFAALVELRSCGQDAFVWHPSDVEKVERLLR